MFLVADFVILLPFQSPPPRFSTVLSCIPHSVSNPPITCSTPFLLHISGILGKREGQKEKRGKEAREGKGENDQFI